MVGQEDIIPVMDRVMIGDAPQKTGAFLGFWAGESNGLVRGDSTASISFMPFYNPISGVAFQACDEEDAVFSQLLIPGIIVVTPVEDHDGALGQIHESGRFDFVDVTSRYGDEGRYVAAVIQADVEFDGPFALLESGPGEKFQAEIDDAGIKGIELAFESEFVFGGDRLTASKEFFEEGPIEDPGFSLVDSGQGGPGDPSASQVVELSALCIKVGHQVPEAVASGKLGHGQGEELGPAVDFAEPGPMMMLFGQSLEIISRNKFHDLSKYGIVVSQGQISSLFCNVFR